MDKMLERSLPNMIKTQVDMGVQSRGSGPKADGEECIQGSREVDREKSESREKGEGYREGDPAWRSPLEVGRMGAPSRGLMMDEVSASHPASSCHDAETDCQMPKMWTQATEQVLFLVWAAIGMRSFECVQTMNAACSRQEKYSRIEWK